MLDSFNLARTKTRSTEGDFSIYSLVFGFCFRLLCFCDARCVVMFDETKITTNSIETKYRLRFNTE